MADWSMLVITILRKEKQQLPFLKKGLPAGVLHLTLFDTSGRPLAERLAFIDNQQVIKPSVNLKTKNTSKRGLNEFSFSIDSAQAESISVLVRANLEQLSFSKEQNIISSLLLSSDIKGSILNPGYYFTHSSDTLSRHLDLLMMTQGWRRFTWADVIAKKEPALKHYIESDISLKGKVTKTDRPDLITSGKVAFIIKGEDSTKIMADAILPIRENSFLIL